MVSHVIGQLKSCTTWYCHGSRAMHLPCCFAPYKMESKGIKSVEVGDMKCQNYFVANIPKARWAQLFPSLVLE